MDAETPQPWQRQPGEPELWYSRFEKFYLTPVEFRTKRAVYVAEWKKAQQKKDAKERRRGEAAKKEAKEIKPPEGLPSGWSEASAKWEWAKRAQAWDDFQRAEKRKKRDKEIEEEREQRLQLLKTVRFKLTEALVNHLHPGSLQWSQVLAGILKYNDAIQIALEGPDGMAGPGDLEPIDIELIWTDAPAGPPREG